MKVVSPPRTITIELTEEEATVICALVGGICQSPLKSKASAIVDELFAVLNGVLPYRTKSYSDFFNGEVEAK